MFKVMSIFGTRPEAVKMCPLIRKLEENEDIDSLVCITGQHKEMLQQVLDVFGINVKYNLNIMHSGQTLTTITTSILQKIEHILCEEHPDLVLVHGDTTTSFVAALAAFYQKIPVGHVEAGLRTYKRYFPYPEEINRELTGKIAELHFAPTEYNRENLLCENIVDNIFVTGNTVIDALKFTVKNEYLFENEKLRDIMQNTRRKILITAHRRENLGEPLCNICNAIKTLAMKYPDLDFIYPVHLNPLVQKVVRNILDYQNNVYLLEPLNVMDMHNTLSKCFLALTDSGGLQEEAPFFGIPVLVLRSETERPEAVLAGTVRVIGTNEECIVSEVDRLLSDAEAYNLMAQAVSPYGNGNASEKIVEFIMEWKNDQCNKRTV